MAVGASAGASHDHEYTEGASLTLPAGATRLDLMNDGHLRKAAKHSAFAWKKYVCDELGHSLADNSLYIITGHDKSSSWVTETWLQQSKACHLDGEINVPEVAKADFSVAQTVDIPEHRRRDSYQSNDLTMPKNQCNFLRGYKLTYSSFNVSKLKLEISNVKDLQNTGQGSYQMQFTKKDSKGDSRPGFGESASGLGGSGELEDVEISDISSKV